MRLDMGEDGSAAEEVRIRRMLLEVVSNSTDWKYWADLKAKAAWAYKDSFDSNENDPRILPMHVGFRTVDDRHLMMDRVLHDTSIESGHRPLPAEVKINRWKYVLVDCGGFRVTQSYVRYPGAMPSLAKFRKGLAAANRLLRQADFFEPRLATDEGRPIFNGIVIHGPSSRNPFKPEFRENGFIQLAFAYDDFLAWAAVFTLDELAAACQNQGKGQGGGATPGGIGPTPTWKVPPKKKE